MNLTPFFRLYGTIKSGMADRTDKEDGPTKYALGNGLYFQWSKFHSNNIARVRRFAVLKNGNIVALKKDGLSFGKSTYDNLKKMFKNMKVLQDIVVVPQLNEGKPCPGMKFKYLKNGLAHLMYQHILGFRVDRCPTCLNPETEPDCTGQDHSCEYGIQRDAHRKTKRRPRRKIKKQRFVESILLNNNVLTCQQLLDITARQDEWFNSNRLCLMEDINKRLRVSTRSVC
ncbi:hypothetical protein BV898_18419 [Hypsibius exemplaris]|uniref:Uncharacterized protein n=1 Tax=Hypsibius exemplaris TaxID=2072580 RepID=A0A9X6NP47_HYPEX|nr:hypothetical protein BV898_18419 [Hypsibius exemplaris]